MRKELVVVLLASASPALAGNYGENVGVGSGSWGGAAASRFDRSTEMSPGMSSYDLYTRQVREIYNRDNPNTSLGKVFNGFYDAAAAIGSWMGTTHQISLGQVNYSQPAYGIGTSSFNGSGFRAEPGPGGY